MRRLLILIISLFVYQNCAYGITYKPSTIPEGLPAWQWNSEFPKVSPRLWTAEDETGEATGSIQAKNKQSYWQEKDKWIKWSSLLLHFCLLTLIILIYRYRKKNRTLLHRIKEQRGLEEKPEKTGISEEYSSEKAYIIRSEEKQNFSQQQILVKRLHEYLLRDRNFAKTDIDRNELTAVLATNRTTLSDAVKTITGKTTKEYINRLRLNEARRMLENNPELTIETIAQECGFTRRTLLRLFRERYNITPSEYRNQE